MASGRAPALTILCVALPRLCSGLVGTALSPMPFYTPVRAEEPQSPLVACSEAVSSTPLSQPVTVHTRVSPSEAVPDSRVSAPRPPQPSAAQAAESQRRTPSTHAALRVPSPSLSSAIAHVERLRPALATAQPEGFVASDDEEHGSEHMERAMLEVRCLCEEAANALQRAANNLPHRSATDVRAGAEAFLAAGRTFEAFQLRQRDRVNAVLDSLLPPGSVRAKILATARAKSEARNASALDELARSGGSTRDKYHMLWEQQWSRRESLASIANMGSSNAITRLLVHYLAGIPAPVLEFARGINTDKGPSADLREMYGDSLSALIRALSPLHTTAILLEYTAARSDRDISSRYPPSHISDAAHAIRKAAEEYASDVQNVVNSLNDAVANSTFSIHAEALSPATT